MVFEGDALKDYRLDFKDNKLVKVELPSAEERKVGKVLVNDKYRIPMYECLGCKNPVMGLWKYCPNCGNNIEECKNE